MPFQGGGFLYLFPSSGTRRYTLVLETHRYEDLTYVHYTTHL